MRAHRRDTRQVIERDGLIGVGGEVRRGAAHGIDAGLHEADGIGPAALAGAESRLPGLDGGIEEADAIRARPPARAAGPAIHAGRRHAIDKGAVGGRDLERPAPASACPVR